HRDPHQHSIGFTLRDYIELVDWAGRQIRDDKRGAINTNTPPILQRLGIDTGAFIEHVNGKHKECYPRMMGRLEKIQQACDRLKRCFIKGMSQSRLLYTG
ncbi:MAG: transposase, partial [Gammaproteobacteria bacterium]